MLAPKGRLPWPPAAWPISSDTCGPTMCTPEQPAVSLLGHHLNQPLTFGGGKRPAVGREIGRSRGEIQALLLALLFGKAHRRKFRPGVNHRWYGTIGKPAFPSQKLADDELSVVVSLVGQHGPATRSPAAKTPAAEVSSRSFTFIRPCSSLSTPPVL
jgi:hypothetical protein